MKLESKIAIFGAISASVVVFTSLSFATDLPIKKEKANILSTKNTNWSGFYVGANAGYSMGVDGGENYCISSAGVFNSGDCRVYPSGVPSSIQASGRFVGGQLGYNWQSDKTVYGVEADFQSSDINGSNYTAGMMFFGDQSPVAGASGAEQHISAFGTLRGRVGVLYSDETLIYATAGLMAARVSVDNYFTNLPNVYYGSASGNKIGPVVGIGIEHKFNANWSAKLEGLYYDLGSLTSTAEDTCCNTPPAPGYKHIQDADFSGGIIRIGINYKF